MIYSDFIKKAFSEVLVKDSISKNRLSPIFTEQETITNTSLDNITNESINNRFYNSSSFNSLNFNDRLKSILNWINVINKSINSVSENYISSVKKYVLLCNRINNENSNKHNKISEVMNYSCIYIDPVENINNKESTTMRIGNYVILPFYFGETSIYSSNVSLSLYSNDTIAYDNASMISSLPLSRPLSLKFTPSDISSVVSLSINLYKTNSNLIYIRTTGPVSKIQAICYLSNTVVQTLEIKDGEALFNFARTDFDRVVFNISTSQYNKSKKTSLQINDILIFNNIYFFESGIFQTSPVEINNYKNLTTFGINCINYNTSPSITFDKYISLAFDPTIVSFAKLTDNTLSIPLAKLNTTIDITRNINSTSKTTFSSVSSADTSKQLSKDFYKVQLPQSISFTEKSAVILGGLAKHYGASTNFNSLQNWSKVNNFYITSILNFENNVTINTANIEITINDNKLSGIVTIPVGFSVIKIHESNIDFTFGTDSQKDLRSMSSVMSDKMFPFNFAYRLGGLPQYTSNGEVLTRELYYNIQGATTIQLPDSFLPFSLKIISVNSGAEYSLSLSSAPVKENTFSVAPYSGSIVAVPNLSDYIVVTYDVADVSIRPCGLLFNRTINYLPYSYIYSEIGDLGVSDDSYFTVQSNETLIDILVPFPDNSSLIYETTTLTDYVILCDESSQSVYASNKLILQSKDDSLTPVIKNIFFQGRN